MAAALDLPVVREAKSPRKAEVKPILAAVALLLALPAAALAGAPRPLERVEPEYPAWALGTGISTEIEVRVLVGRDGRVRDVQIVPYNVKNDVLTPSMRASFDSAAVRAVRDWTFRPGTRRGRPVTAWHVVRMTFADPSSEPVASSPESSSVRPAAPDSSGELSPFPEPIEREAPEWPAAAPYVCRGRLVVDVSIDATGRARMARVMRRSIECPDALIAAAIDEAALRAARGWRYSAAELEGLPMPLLVPIAFQVPPPRADGSVIVVCVRDSSTGRLRPGAEIQGRDGKAVGRADTSGWLVLAAPRAQARELRAHVVFCWYGGFRRVRPWRQRGDDVTLYLSRNTCVDDTR
jgi:TonB family protein